MNKNSDSPKYIDVKRTDNQRKAETIERMKELYRKQSFGVLATQGEEDASTSLISFVVSDDFSQLIFASPSDTKKIDLIKQNQEVSILVDNRDQQPETINDIVAVSAKGHAKILDKNSKEEFSNALIEKHQYLKDFIAADSTVIVSVDISKYYYVSSFQETLEWSPD